MHPPTGGFRPESRTKRPRVEGFVELVAKAGRRSGVWPPRAPSRAGRPDPGSPEVHMYITSSPRRPACSSGTLFEPWIQHAPARWPTFTNVPRRRTPLSPPPQRQRRSTLSGAAPSCMQWALRPLALPSQQINWREEDLRNDRVRECKPGREPGPGGRVPYCIA